jgi:NitT/TauT family transport system substrate-binding protein
MNRTTLSRSRATALLFGGAAVCAIATPSKAQTATIRIATLPIESAAEVFYAKEMGFFAQAGLDADIQTMQGTPLIEAAITAGAIDIGYGVLDTLASVRQKGIPVAVLAPAAEYVSDDGTDCGSRGFRQLAAPEGPRF